MHQEVKEQLGFMTLKVQHWEEVKGNFYFNFPATDLVLASLGSKNPDKWAENVSEFLETNDGVLELC